MPINIPNYIKELKNEFFDDYKNINVRIFALRKENKWYIPYMRIDYTFEDVSAFPSIVSDYGEGLIFQEIIDEESFYQRFCKKNDYCVYKTENYSFYFAQNLKFASEFNEFKKKIDSHYNSYRLMFNCKDTINLIYYNTLSPDYDFFNYNHIRGMEFEFNQKTYEAVDAISEIMNFAYKQFYQPSIIIVFPIKTFFIEIFKIGVKSVKMLGYHWDLKDKYQRMISVSYRINEESKQKVNPRSFGSISRDNEFNGKITFGAYWKGDISLLDRNTRLYEKEISFQNFHNDIIIKQFFKSKEFYEYFQERKKEISEIIQKFDITHLISYNQEDILQNLILKFKLEQLTIDFERKRIIGTTDINTLILIIPYQGPLEYFDYYPSKRSMSELEPTGYICQQFIQLIIINLDEKISKLQDIITYQMNNLKEYTEVLNKEVEKYNDLLEKFIKSLLKEQKEKLNQILSITESINIPIVFRDYTLPFINIPVYPKRISIIKPKMSNLDIQQIPNLDNQIYENILEVCLNMSKVMERTPKTFSGMHEESIRDIFLITLNAYFVGEATGETFNKRGKSDILIRHKNSNVFIAECKFWKGPEGLKKTIDQLLRYTTWRDTKTAILLFNRKINIETILKKISSIISNHNCFIEKYEFKSDILKQKGVFGYTFHISEDNITKVLLTIMVFNIPKSSN